MVALGNFITKNNISNQERYIEITQKKALFNRFNDLSGIQAYGSKSQPSKRAPWGRVGEAEESPE
jgi:hypothetical protein